MLEKEDILASLQNMYTGLSSVLVINCRMQFCFDLRMNLL